MIHDGLTIDLNAHTDDRLLAEIYAALAARGGRMHLAYRVARLLRGRRWWEIWG